MATTERSVDDLVDEAVQLIWNTYRGYTSNVFDRVELDHFVRMNVVVVLDCVRRRTPLRPDELVHARELGEQRAHQGVPLESVIQAFRSTERVMLLHVLRTHRDGSSDTPTELALSCFDALTNAMIDAYREASSAIDAVSRRAETELATALTNGWELDPAEAERWTGVLGVDQGRAHTCVVFTLSKHSEPLLAQRFRRRMVTKLSAARIEPVLCWEGDGSLIAFAPVDSDSTSRFDACLTTLLNDPSGDCTGIFVGDTAPTLRAGHRSYLQARAVQDVASRKQMTGKMLLYNDVLLDVLLGHDVPARERFVADRLGPIEDATHLLETIAALANCNMSQARAAKQMYVHVNTVALRARKIHELTGRNPLVFTDLVELYLATR
ncbi:helix-turn-helix domain-containing protein [Rhodococcus sp. BP-252]|uniref:PucR C-terminal helix-turn-helix domain-containing protein n=1 Tax=Rhodococcoides kyotonense TaxID=398843 RepID=A0A177YJ99_9NOCA|nr:MULTISPECIES: helix-turn-helix domain-containing protein [Rhodococcus]MBY6410762.1 helix-turn-helix domain-containing protein [Rhodococcus sp. BP-320]MBY6415413.1 helix-turn-helix domain-containing protein [Rhodococcus sp. BP-321]MBY6420028.1 helix-turn-helix domain-containing protein [Rhodococcus sp. BP-324]MBY6425318.1 helix-turn-helix domain-containing protein [Rhodococcus sp. BP-323]MBY6430619.1 helix-turn-helix domain-containing protein [Rhodococcus sp. BP-322]